jgi:two-component system, LytTR family, sensor kinase
MIGVMEIPGVRAARIIAFSLCVGLFFTAQLIVMRLASGRPLNIEWDVLQELLYWSVWALMVPLVLLAAGHWPITSRPQRRAVAAHAAVGTSFAVVQALVAFGLHLVVLWLAGAVDAEDAGSWMAHQRTGLVWGVFTGTFFYWLILGVHAGLELVRRSGTLEGELVRAKMDALTAQLRPHFLFNTLNTISVLTVEDAGKARQMILRLGSLLRRSLDEDRHELPLRQEVELLNEYLDIQRVRFGDRLSVISDIHPLAAEAKVPVFLLQPLVENAIRHGAIRDDGGTTIWIRAARDAGTLHLTVENVGPVAEGHTFEREGIGLRNTRERLRHLYGGGAELRFRTSSGPSSSGTNGTCVEVVIPFSVAPA